MQPASPLPEDLARDWVVRTELALVDLPHIVVCRDPGTDSLTYAGPFPSGLAALAAAERASGEHGSPELGDAPLEFTVAPLFDSLD